MKSLSDATAHERVRDYLAVLIFMPRTEVRALSEAAVRLLVSLANLAAKPIGQGEQSPRPLFVRCPMGKLPLFWVSASKMIFVPFHI